MIRELERMLNSVEVDVRREAALRLRERPDDRADIEAAIKLLLKAMQDGSWRVRKPAVDALLGSYQLDEFVDGLIGLLYIEDNAGARNSAIEALVRLGPLATDCLMESFSTDSADVRKFIIDIIGEVLDQKSIPMLIGALRDEDENVKASAVEYLGSMKEPTVVDALIGILNEGELWTSYPAVEALGRIADMRALPVLLGKLSTKNLREPTLRAIGQLAGSEDLPTIVPYLEDRSKAVQNEAVMTIEKIYARGIAAETITDAMQTEFGERVVGILLGLAASHRQEVSASAIMLIGLLKDIRSVEPLLEMARDEQYEDPVRRTLARIGRDNPGALLRSIGDKGPDVTRFLLGVMADVASPEYFDTFVRYMDKDDGHARINAARGLANIGDARAVPALMARLNDQYTDVQEAVVKALALMRESLDIANLVRLVRTNNPILRRNGVLLLGAVGTPEAVAAIGFALKDDNTRVRKSVITALGSIGTEDACDHLINALLDEDMHVRASAAAALGMTGRKKYMQQLSLLLCDNEDLVRAAACKALGLLGNQEAIRILGTLRYDESGFVVTSVLDALGRIGGEEARDVLLEMIESNDAEIVRTALKNLSGMEGTSGRVLPFLRHRDWATRVAAMEALEGNRDKAVHREVSRAYEAEEDTIVRKVMEKFLHV